MATPLDNDSRISEAKSNVKGLTNVLKNAIKNMKQLWKR